MNKKWDELEAGLDAIFNIESIEAQLTEANAEITTLRETLANDLELSERQHDLLVRLAEDICDWKCPTTWKTKDGRPPCHAICQEVTKIVKEWNDAKSNISRQL